MAIKSPLQQIIVAYLKRNGVSYRKFAAAVGVSDAVLGTYTRMESAMGVDTLDKILVAYPGVKSELIAYLGGNTDVNITPETKRAALQDPAPFYYAALKSIVNKDNEIDDLKRQLEEYRKKGKKRASPPDSAK